MIFVAQSKVLARGQNSFYPVFAKVLPEKKIHPAVKNCIRTAKKPAEGFMVAVSRVRITGAKDILQA